MHEYLYEADLVRIGVLAGIVVSILLYERLQITTGGAIVPGYLALFVLAPLSIIVTLATAYVTYRIVNGPISRRMILYGRRKFEVEVLVGLAIVFVIYSVIESNVGLPSSVAAAYGIGFVIPGLIAHDMFRQGVGKTTGAVLGGTAIVAAVLVIGYGLISLTPSPPPALSLDQPRGYEISLLFPAVVVSVLAGLVIYRKLSIRSGGLVTAAYLALVAPNPADIVFAASVALLTYVLVTRVLTTRLLLFGRRKLAMMLLVAASIAWVGEIAVVWASNGVYHPWAGFNAITLMVPGLLANDAERQGPTRTAVGATIATVTVLTLMAILTAALNGLNLSI